MTPPKNDVVKTVKCAVCGEVIYGTKYPAFRKGNVVAAAMLVSRHLRCKMIEVDYTEIDKTFADWDLVYVDLGCFHAQ